MSHFTDSSSTRPNSTNKQVVGKITFMPDAKEAEIFENESLLTCSLRLGVPHYHACGGHGLCSTCRVFIINGLENCAPRNTQEKAMAQRLGFPNHLRLACQTKTTYGNVVLKRPILDYIDLQIIMSTHSGNSPMAIGQE